MIVFMFVRRERKNRNNTNAPINVRKCVEKHIVEIKKAIQYIFVLFRKSTI